MTSGPQKQHIFFITLTAASLVFTLVVNRDIFVHGTRFGGVKLFGVDFSPGGQHIITRIDTRPELTQKLRFLSNYKCPCWLERDVESRPKLRCLPYYYMIGFPKCGTTDLCKRMTMHPLISAKVAKGNHWFSTYRFGKHHELSSYLQLFEYAVETDIRKITTENGYHNAIFGDCTPSVGWDNRLMFARAINLNLTREPKTNAHVLKHLNPKSKIIVILRNPVDRLYSEYLFFSGKQKNLEEFHRRVVYSINNMTECLKNYSLRSCVFYHTVQVEVPFRKADKVRLQIGIYHVLLEDFIQSFPRDQIFIVKLETYSRQINKTLQEIFSFLDVGEITDLEMLKNISAKSPYNTRSSDDYRVGDMLQKTRTLLENFYKPYNERLAEMLGPDFDYNPKSIGL